MQQQHHKQQAASNLPLAVAWSCGTLISMLMMGLSGRELSAYLEPHHVALYRNAICLALLVPFVAWVGFNKVRTNRLKGHVARNTIHFAAQWGWFFGLGALPLAEVFAVEFSAPIWAALLASIFLGEKMSATRVFAIALGFVGILVLLRPGIAIINPASFVVLAAAFGYAVSYVMTRSLMKGESALTVVWWMNVVQLPIGVALSMTDFVVPPTDVWPWLAVLGIAGLTSHTCLSKALQYADVSIVVPLDFLRLPLGALIGWLMYEEAVDPFLGLGALLILLGNWVNLRGR